VKISNQVIEDVVREVSGDNVIPLVKLLKNKTNVSEFVLAEKLEIEINSVRNMLYRLYQANLVSSIRRKDKKKGWYIYYWTFNAKRIKYLLIDIYKKRVERLTDKLKLEEGHQFFICPNKCVRMEFENATDFEFKCPECGELMLLHDNSDKITELKKDIIEHEAKLKNALPKEKKVIVKKEKVEPKKKVVKKKVVKKKVVKKKVVKKKVVKKKVVKKKVVKKKKTAKK